MYLKDEEEMKQYYVNKKPQGNGDHEVHREDCKHLPHLDHKEYLGLFSNCKDAVEEATKIYAQADGCFFCCKECHKR